MTPLHRDPHYTFRFADDRLVVNLGGVAATLEGDEFRRVAGDLAADEAMFVVDSPEKRRGLFGAR